ncbi:hypothetical protein H2198_005507 [Neophaeococcomyces mojaviensis]|uniref:Uncharacterized protein n=1 Tax=Neophaeococcomyces mojaviensis TaxID=3383035 RepID=A0ACC3A5R7_9EURO|nr:hypothetical protein H2198_005507 [Knufia sp. JES_112]
MEALDIFDVEVRAAVSQLQENFSSHEFQTCYYCYIYENYDFNAASLRLSGVPPKLVDIDRSLRDYGPKGNVSQDVTADLGVLPAEIWQMVCSYLDFKSLASLRLASSGLTDIAAEYLVDRIRIDASFESLKRLKGIADNDCLRKNVKEIIFEGGLLANVGCVHSYMKHFDLEHHQRDKPQKPLKGKGFDRAMRLYTRNIAKWEKEIEDKYRAYRKKYEAQQLLLLGPKAHLFECMNKFPNLKHVVLRTDAQCDHMLSQRFKTKFCNDCAVPLSIETAPTTWQLEHILRPGILTLSGRILSPKFFDGTGFRDQNWLNSVFADLYFVQLMFRPEGETLQQLASLQSPVQHIRMLENGHLASALSTCHNLRSLTINFYPSHGMVTSTALDDILLPNHVFPKLKSLDLDFFTTTEDALLEVLECQPALESFCIAFAHLSAGSWPSVIHRMRRNLKLGDFYCQGYMEDGDRLYPMDLCERDAWTDGERLTLATCVDCYVTDSEYPEKRDDELTEDEHDQIYNPLRCMDEDFDEDTELTLTFGSLSGDEEDEIGNDDSNEDTDMDSLPDLESSSEGAMDVD